ncbi:MAG TPA: hypothetical protein VFB79_21450 [Candidatus Angelobacter sp.]|nr:hypothetical protein [Candidatus Angelobacter sp.]
MSTLTIDDGINAALILLPLAALFFGIGIGVVATKYGYFVVYREHLENHSYARVPSPECPFCKEERGTAARLDLSLPDFFAPEKLDQEREQ